MTDRRLLRAFVGATVATVLASALMLAVAGATDEIMGLVLRLSAQLAFVVLLVVFVARPLRQLISTPLTGALLRNRALLGLVFAGIHTGHLLLLIYKARHSADFELTLGGNLLGALIYLLIYAMVLTTFSTPKRALGPKNWRILHKTGLFVTTYAFAQTQLPASLDDLSGMNWWLVVLLTLALLIRLTAFFAKPGGLLQDRRN